MSALLRNTPAEEALIALSPESDAAHYLRNSGLPGRRTEEWRWTDLRTTLRDAISLSAPIQHELPKSSIDLDSAIVFTFANGYLLAQPSILPPELSVKRESPSKDRALLPLAMVATDLVSDTLIITITGTLEHPLKLRFYSDGDGLHHARIKVRLAPKAHATLVEAYDGNDNAFCQNILVEYEIDHEANLNRIILQESTPNAININTALVGVGENAHYHQSALAFGGKLTRLETHITTQFEGAQTNIHGAYFLSGQNHLDNTTSVHHAAANCTTEEIFKGVLNDKSKGVFQGKFHVTREAQQTDARMSHNALLLSDNCEVNAKPELKIYADNVQCTHGNTAGAMDEEALFYMRQRGLSEHEARAILVEAFAGEVLDNIPNAQVQSQFTHLVRDFMGRTHVT